jgi:HK97 family phage portal protein
MNLWQRIRNLLPRAKPGEDRVYVAHRQAGVVVTEDTALTFGAVWACVSLISRTIAALPWHVYERTGTERKPVDTAVSWLLNNRPNAEMTAFAFREVMLVHVLTWGNAYAEIERDMAGRVAALWPMAPDCVELKRDSTGALVYEVRTAAGETYTLPPDRVLHIHGMGYDGLVGYSPVRMAARSIGLGLGQEVFGGAFYANGTQFGSVIEMPTTLNPTQIKDLEAYYNTAQRGPDKAFKMKVTPSGVKLHTAGMPMTDAQFLESRKFSVTDIARWYGVPPHKIADLDRATNNNIEHQGIEFVSDAIVPWAVRLEQEVNGKLFGQRAQGRIYTKLSVNALMRGDSKSRAEFYRLMTQMGALSINEVRAMEEMNGIGPDGDKHLVQLNQTTLEHLVAEPEPAPPAVPVDPAADPDPAADRNPSNVIRREALEFLRAQRNQA